MVPNAAKNENEAIVKRERINIENSNNNIRNFRVQEGTSMFNYLEQMYVHSCNE